MCQRHMQKKFRGNGWFNRCEEVRMERERPWDRWRRNKRNDQWNKYIEERNKYVLLSREEKINYEKNIIDKCKDQTKLFYRYLNWKLE